MSPWAFQDLRVSLSAWLVVANLVLPAIPRGVLAQTPGAPLSISSTPYDRSAALESLARARKLITQDKPLEAIAMLKRGIASAPDLDEMYVELFRYTLALNDCRTPEACQCGTLLSLRTLVPLDAFSVDERVEVEEELRFCRERKEADVAAEIPGDLSWAIVQLPPAIEWWSIDGKRVTTLSGAPWVVSARPHQFRIGAGPCQSEPWPASPSPKSRYLLDQPLLCPAPVWPRWIFYGGLGLVGVGLAEGALKDRHQGKNQELYLREQWIANAALNAGMAAVVVGGSAWLWNCCSPWAGAADYR